jgi:hypothetical protein
VDALGLVEYPGSYYEDCEKLPPQVTSAFSWIWIAPSEVRVGATVFGECSVCD